MRVLEVGCDFHYGPSDSGAFRSTQSFLDYDLVVWNPTKTRDEYLVSPDFFIHEGRTILKKQAHAKLLNDLARRHNEMTEMMNLGRSIVVWASDPQATKLTVSKGHGYVTVDLLSALPVDITTGAMSGKNIEFRGREPFSKFWATNQERLSYKAQVSASNGKPLFFVKGTDKVVGMYLSINRGNLLVLPSFLVEGVSRHQYAEMEQEYVLSLVRLVEDLSRMVGEPKLPSWSREYLLPSERDHLSALGQLQADLTRLQQRIQCQENLLAELEKYKIMFSGSGKPLERQVRRVFEELGFSVVETLPNRDDLVMTHGDRVAVVEIKGTSRSAAEKNAAQLEKWVSEYYLSHRVEPKGILLVNAFKDTALVDRNDAPFPHQMVSYSENRKHCLITGLQLLGLYLDCKDHPEKKAEMVDSIFKTQGIFDSYHDWTKFLVRDESSSAEDER